MPISNAISSIFGYVSVYFIIPDIRYSYYQYGHSQGDANIYDTGVTCDSLGKSCASEFIQIPNVQIFNGRYRRLKASDLSTESHP